MPAMAFILCLILSLLGPSARVLAEPESANETIHKCLQDLRSPDRDIRRAAALVIGKYNSLEARAALLLCLSDPDADIRQSALVSLTEESRSLSLEVSQAILKLLADPDVHIRRIASSLLDNVAMSQGPGRSFTVVDGKLVRKPSAALLDQKHLAEALNRALSDEDRSVRRNILLKARYFPGLLQPQALLPFLQDESAEIVVLALQALGSAYEEEAEVPPAIRPLLQHPQTAVRLELLNYLSRAGDHGLPGLEVLAEDPQAEVRLGALRHLANTGNPDFFPKLQQALLDEELPAALRLPLLNSLRNYGKDALPVFQATLDSSAQSLRSDAMQHLALQRPGTVPISVFLDALRDSQAEVRHFAGQALLQQQESLSDSQIRALLQAPYPQTRALALRLASQNLPLALELAQQALLDEDLEVRKTALQIISFRQDEQALEILLLSLEDENAQIRDCAAVLLLPQVGNPRVAAALQKYLPQCEGGALKIRLQQLLQKAPDRPPANIRRTTPIRQRRQPAGQ